MAKNLLFYLILLVFFASCGGSDEIEEEDKTALGVGTSVTMPSGGEQSQPVTDSTGNTVGTFSYDNIYFFINPLVPPIDPIILSLVNADGTLFVTVTRSQGRADTACRYIVARLMRDSNYEDGKTGWKTNSYSQDLYMAKAQKTTYHAYYCGKFGDTSNGLIVAAISGSAAPLESKPLFALLNSIQAQ